MRQELKEFKAWLDESCVMCRKAGYRGFHGERMRKKYGDIKAAELLIHGPGFQSGLTWCWEHGLLSRCFEAGVVKFPTLFHTETVCEAKKRLRKFS